MTIVFVWISSWVFCVCSIHKFLLKEVNQLSDCMILSRNHVEDLSPISTTWVQHRYTTSYHWKHQQYKHYIRRIILCIFYFTSQNTWVGVVAWFMHAWLTLCVSYFRSNVNVRSKTWSMLRKLPKMMMTFLK